MPRRGTGLGGGAGQRRSLPRSVLLVLLRPPAEGPAWGSGCRCCLKNKISLLGVTALMCGKKRAVTLLPLNGSGCSGPGLPSCPRCAPHGPERAPVPAGALREVPLCVLGKGLRRVAGELGPGPGVGVPGYHCVGRGRAPALAFTLMVLCR